jgi:NAD(P)-dependent dehydrogenase (short-subunit alcohol dehydrogenase family)
MEQFEGKTAVVTGAASGIGLAMARKFAAEGMNVVLADIEVEALDAAVAELRSSGTQALGVICDVAQRSEVQRLADQCIEQFGAVHVVCNNAGVASGGTLWEFTEQDWQWVLGVDLWAVIHGVSIFVPLLIEAGGGHIVNTASMAGLTSTPFMGPYNVAKHGVVTLSETLFHELAMLAPNVGVTVLCPGWVQTQINRSERNRPEAERTSESPSATESGIGAALDKLIAEGLEPSDVAQLVFDAVRDNKFYVLTHPEWSPMVQRNTETMLAGNNPRVFLPGSR